MAVGDGELYRSASRADGIRDLDHFVERKTRLDFFVRLTIDEDGDGLLAIEVLVLLQVNFRLVTRYKAILVVAVYLLPRIARVRDVRQQRKAAQVPLGL